MKYTELTRKEQGAIRYGKQQARHRAKQKSKTRPSDTRVRTAPGISGKSRPQTEFVSRFPPPKRAARGNAYAALIAQLDQILPRK